MHPLSLRPGASYKARGTRVVRVAGLNAKGVADNNSIKDGVRGKRKGPAEHEPTASKKGGRHQPARLLPEHHLGI